MGWSTTLFCSIDFNRKSYNSLYEVEDDIKELKDILQSLKNDLRSYAIMTEPQKLLHVEDENLSLMEHINFEVSDIFSRMEEYYFELFKLEYLRDNWENCHTKEGLAIDIPEGIDWDSAYLEGDFVKTVKHPNSNDHL